eukprot:Phypoly_transcript_04173.p1 GENE.Phypoly_transcript_04173~~Phypoly_transcript_04173.p1  ORF type:complete len:519 (+),score=38.70 Phypoly_transcript_04173:477-2033(+)
MWVFGGKNESQQSMNTLHCFNLLTRRWLEPIFDLKNKGPPARHAHSAVIYEGELVIFGGCTDKPFADLFTFSLGTNKWHEIKVKEKATKPAPRWGHSATVFGDSMIIFAGKNIKGILGDMYSFDFKTKKWAEVQTPRSSCPVNRKSHVAVAYKNKFYVLGGRKSIKMDVCDFWCYDFNKNEWRELPCFSGPSLVGATGTVHGNTLIVIGGAVAKSPTGIARSYDFETEKWQELPHLNTSNTCFHTAVEYANYIVLLGGRLAEKTPTSNLKFGLITKSENEREKGSISTSENGLLATLLDFNLVRILRFVDVRTLVNFSCTCRRAFNLGDDNEVWYKAFRNTYDSFGLHLWDDNLDWHIITRSYVRSKGRTEFKRTPELMAKMAPSISFGIGIFGDHSVGKTAMLIQYIQSHFIAEYECIEDDSYRKLLVLAERTFAFDIFDTVLGPDGKHPSRQLWFRDKTSTPDKSYVFVFAINDRESFLSIPMHYRYVWGENKGCVQSALCTGREQKRFGKRKTSH